MGVKLQTDKKGMTILRPMTGFEIQSLGDLVGAHGHRIRGDARATAIRQAKAASGHSVRGTGAGIGGDAEADGVNGAGSKVPGYGAVGVTASFVFSAVTEARGHRRAQFPSSAQLV